MHPLFVWLFFSFFVSIFFYPPKFPHFEENLLVALQYWDKYFTPSFQSGNSWSYFFGSAKNIIAKNTFRQNL